jgi:nucleotide-binding universal stress UspA family protein
MFERILYPTDFSDVSKKALDYIKQLKEGGAKEVTILHVLDERGIDAAARYAPGSSVEVEKKMREEAGQEIRSIEEELKERGFKVDARITIGIPLREILNIEGSEAISVIVIGSHGKSNLEEMLLGSVSEKVIRKCKSPVLVIKR